MSHIQVAVVGVVAVVVVVVAVAVGVGVGVGFVVVLVFRQPSIDSFDNGVGWRHKIRICGCGLLQVQNRIL